jgi:hypothetical protein
MIPNELPPAASRALNLLIFLAAAFDAMAFLGTLIAHLK